VTADITLSLIHISSTYQYNPVVFKLTNAGLWRGDASVKQKLEFFASRRIRI